MDSENQIHAFKSDPVGTFLNRAPIFVTPALTTDARTTLRIFLVTLLAPRFADAKARRLHVLQP